MPTCPPCAEGDHEACKEENKDKITGCPGNCQHRKTTNVVHQGVVYVAPEGVTAVVNLG